MDFLKAQFTRISEHGGTIGHPEMLVFSLVTIMVMTLIFWSAGGRAGDVPILGDQPLSQEDLGQISTSWKTQSDSVQSGGRQIYFPPTEVEIWRCWAIRRPCRGI